MNRTYRSETQSRASIVALGLLLGALLASNAFAMTTSAVQVDVPAIELGDDFLDDFEPIEDEADPFEVEDQEQEIAFPPLVYAFLILAGSVLTIYLLIQSIVCLILVSCLKAIPSGHRRLTSVSVWLLLVPVFPLVWNFFVFVRLSRSYQEHFRAKDRAEFGKCGEGLAWTFSGLIVCCALTVPFLNTPFIGIVAVLCLLGLMVPTAICLIIYLMKMLKLKRAVIAHESK